MTRIARRVLCVSRAMDRWGPTLLALMALAACGREPPDEPARSANGAALPPAQTGEASYYGREFAGEKTASGEPHSPHEMTAASRSLPLGTVAKVTNRETGRSVAVEVNDRGPYAKNRILDVSEKAAARLGMKEDGTAPVIVQPVAAPVAASQK